jgi:predicted NAD/FAD-dependent oxidoreductase
VRVVVVGAGVAGLVGARALSADHDVVVVDKGRSVGGRLATRRIGGAVLDHGAQFFTVRTDAFRAQVDDWLGRDVARVWCHGFGGDDGHPRYMGTRGMTSLAKDLATGLDVRCSTMAFSIRPGDDCWHVVIDDGTIVPADAVVLTSPVPQSWALLMESGVEVSAALTKVEYERTIGLLAVLDGPSAVPAPGGVQLDPHDATATFSFVADNAMKGISPLPALTLHATVPFSHARWDDPIDAVRADLLTAAAPWIGAANVVEAQVKKWRFGTPIEPWPDPCCPLAGGIVLAGDAFAGPKIEGAFTSGLAAAAAVRAFV